LLHLLIGNTLEEGQRFEYIKHAVHSGNLRYDCVVVFCYVYVVRTPEAIRVYG
jgi:hypothetical protein